MLRFAVFLCVGFVGSAGSFGLQTERDYRRPPGFVYDDPGISSKVASVLAKNNVVLTVLNVKRLPEDVAVALADSEPEGNTCLTLPSVTEVSEGAARALARRRGIIRLWGVTSLSPSVAVALGEQVGGRLELPSVSEVSLETAVALAGCKRSSLVLGITSVSPALAGVLAKYQGKLTLDIESISLETALAFGGSTGYVDFGRARVTRDVAEALLKHEGAIGLTQVAKLEPGVGDVLAKHRWELNVSPEEFDSVALVKKLMREPNATSKMNNVRTMTAEIARAYVECRPGHVFLPRLEVLSPEAAAEFASSSGPIILPGIKHVTPEAARELLDRSDPVELLGIKALVGADGLAVARTIARSSSPTSLQNLKQASREVLDQLTTRASIVLPDKNNVTTVP